MHSQNQQLKKFMCHVRVSMGCARRGKVNHENITGFVWQAFKFSDFHKISPQKCQRILFKIVVYTQYTLVLATPISGPALM